MILKLKNKKAFTLMEMTVSLGITAILIVIFFNALIISMRVSFKNVARSSIREELTTIVNEISNDIRNADSIVSCEGATCEIQQRETTVIWSACENRVCKYENNNGNGNVLVFQSIGELSLQSLLFERGFVQNDNIVRTNILITAVGSHTNQSLNINNVFRQTSASTRNYEF